MNAARRTRASDLRSPGGVGGSGGVGRPLATRGQLFPAHGGPAEAPALGAAPSPKAKRRDDLRALRAAAVDLHPFDAGRGQASRIHQCGRTVIGGSVADAFVGRPADAGAASSVYGAQSCGRAWECAVCRARIGAMHLEELTACVDYWLDRPGSGRVYFLTLTVRHSSRDELEGLRRGLSRSWSRLVEGRAWQDFKVKNDAHFVRAFDATLGPAGWHVHFHALLFVRDALDTHETKRMLFERWSRIVARELGEDAVPSRAHAVRLQTMKGRDELPKYVAKLGMELTNDLGKGHDEEADAIGGFTPWELLAELGYLRRRAREAQTAGEDELARELNAESAELAGAWHAWRLGMHGAKWVTWSKNLRALAGLSAELTDEQAAALEDEEPECIARIPMELRKVVLYHPSLVATLLDAADRGLPLAPFVDATLGAVDAAIWHEANDPSRLAEWYAARPAELAEWHAERKAARAAAKAARAAESES